MLSYVVCIWPLQLDCMHAAWNVAVSCRVFQTLFFRSRSFDTSLAHPYILSLIGFSFCLLSTIPIFFQSIWSFPICSACSSVVSCVHVFYCIDMRESLCSSLSFSLSNIFLFVLYRFFFCCSVSHRFDFLSKFCVESFIRIGIFCFILCFCYFKYVCFFISLRFSRYLLSRFDSIPIDKDQTAIIWFEVSIFFVVSIWVMVF